MGKSIQIKISIILLISILIIMAITGVTLYIFESKKLLLDLTSNFELTHKRLINSLREPLWNIDYKEVKNIISIEMKNHDVSAIVILNDQNDKITGFMKNNSFDIINYDDSDIKKSYLYFESDISKDDMKIGSLRLAFTDLFLKRSLIILIFRLIVQTVILTLVTIGVLYIAISRQIISPIIILNRSVGQFAEKDFSTRIDIKSDDEFGSLSKNFNDMAQTIQEYSESMEHLVAKRTEELKIANDELLKTNEQMKKELKMAQKIQLAIIPKTFPNVEDFQFSGMYIPMESLGGDYYDVIKISDTKTGMLIVDVCGHGVPAALITTMAKVSFSSNARTLNSTSDVVKVVNDELYNIIGNMEYLTAFFCIIDSENGTIEYTNAGHPSSVIIKKNGDIVELGQNSPIIGFLNSVEFNSNTEKIEDGDRIVLYTDGVTEAKNEKDEIYDFEKFKKILIDNMSLPNHKLTEVISAEIREFSGGKDMQDDVTILIGDFTKKQGRVSVDFEIFIERKKVEDEDLESEIKNKITLLNEKLYASLEYNKLANYEKALPLLEEINGKYNRKEENTKIMEILGFVYYKLNRIEDAKNVWSEVLKLDPNNNKIKNNLKILNERV